MLLVRGRPSSTLFPYTTLFRSYGGTRMTRADVRAKALATGTRLVELTGGEPLLQPGVFPLMSELCDAGRTVLRSEEHTSELQSLRHLVCRLLLEKKKKNNTTHLPQTTVQYPPRKAPHAPIRPTARPIRTQATQSRRSANFT